MPCARSTGEVTVTVTPTHLDASCGEFIVAFDTHTVLLDLDVAARSHLDVDGVAWVLVQWSGDGPGSHHRAGILRFGAAGPTGGSFG